MARRREPVSNIIEKASHWPLGKRREYLIQALEQEKGRHRRRLIGEVLIKITRDVLRQGRHRRRSTNPAGAFAMSDLDDLGDIADQTAFGRGRSRYGAPHRGGRPRLASCNSPDHMKGENIRVYSVKGKKLRTVCKLCDKVRRRQRPAYSAQGYPL